MDFLIYTFFFFCTMVSIFLLLSFVLIINRKTVSFMKRLYATVAISLVNLLPFLFPNNNIAVFGFISTLLAMFLSYYLISHRKVLDGVLCSFIHLASSVVLEYLSFLLIDLFKIPSIVEVSQTSIMELTLIRVIPIGILGFVHLIIYFFKYKGLKLGNLSKREQGSIISQIVIAVLLFCPNIIYFEYAHDIVPRYMMIINLISALILILYGIFNILKENELATKRMELKSQTDYNLSLEITLRKLKQFKHDYSNLLQSISGCIYLKDLDKLEKIFKEVKTEFSIVNTTPIIDSYFKRCPPLYGLLLTKVILAESNNIELRINVVHQLDCEKISEYNTVKILGILMDNAIEAAMESQDRLVEIVFTQEDSRQKIMITNSYQGEIKKENLFDYGYTTKENHMGSGLFEVANIVSKRKNLYIETKVDQLVSFILWIGK